MGLSRLEIRGSVKVQWVSAQGAFSAQVEKFPVPEAYENGYSVWGS